ncbi:MAG: methionyl-tRNA formyltransferase [Actinomycetota bacterium]|nr:methionyl-tRNA formyltransferase [Actinomycetota bacterium]
MTIRLAFLGNDRWSVPSLEALAASDRVEVALVVTNPPRPAGRGSAVRATPVADAARASGLALLETAGVRSGEGFAALEAAAPDALVVVAYGQLLSGAVLRLPPLGAVNVHFSLLPRWRGASPVQRALMAGDPTTGVSVMVVDEGLDTGPILATHEVPIAPDDDAGSLGARLATLGGILLVGALIQLGAGTATPLAQGETGVTLAPKLTPQERWIDWTQDASAIVSRVRALSPEPGASTLANGATLKVFRAEAGRTALEAGTRPGTLLGVGADGVTVAAAGGAVRLLEVAAAGRKRMSAAEWSRGARVSAGDLLG